MEGICLVLYLIKTTLQSITLNLYSGHLSLSSYFPKLNVVTLQLFLKEILPTLQFTQNLHITRILEAQ